MPRLFWPNFDFEHELASGESWRPTEKLRRLNSRFAPVLGALCDREDRVVLPGKLPPSERVIREINVNFVSEEMVRDSADFRGADWELIPWGVAASLKRLAKSRDWGWNQPDPEKVKTWNDRLTSVEREPSSLSGEAIPHPIHSIDQLACLLRDRADGRRWVVKARFGMSGRERLVGEGTDLAATQLGWLKKRFAQQQTLIWEPWLDIVDEVGLQYDISKTGEVRFLAALPLLNAPTGEYMGSRLSLSPEERSQWSPAITLGESLAREAGETGYWGPFSIDAVRFRDRDDIHLRPVMEINARWTMGRLAYEWGTRLKSGDGKMWRLGEVIA
ncbi:MAG: hypothetical protein HUJ26_03725 [Planctomycetaceae bacterium]|nr:hypothetical protein [Planctomycetaceae bacterium]